ncbi:hypothetical protein D3C79_1006490 [compost metagenome]
MGMLAEHPFESTGPQQLDDGLQLTAQTLQAFLVSRRRVVVEHIRRVSTFMAHGHREQRNRIIPLLIEHPRRAQAPS